MDKKQKEIVLALGLVAALVLVLVVAGLGYRKLSSLYAQRQNSGTETVSVSTEPSDSSESSDFSEPSDSSDSSQTAEPSDGEESPESSESSETTESSEGPELSESVDVAQNTAPDFKMLNMDGEEVRLSDFWGKPIVLNFWATWCGPCKMEMPYIDEAYQQYGDDVVFLLVNLTDGSRDTVESATAFVEKEGYSFPIYFDVEYDGVYTYGINAIPTTYFIDENGVLYDTQTGSMTHNMLNQKIEELLN